MVRKACPHSVGEAVARLLALLPERHLSLFAVAGGRTWVSYTAPGYLATRHHLDDALTARLGAIEAISDSVVAPA